MATGRRCGPSSPRSCQVTGSGSERCRTTGWPASSPSGARRSTRLDICRLAGRWSMAAPVCRSWSRWSSPKSLPAPGCRRGPERRLRHQHAWEHAAGVANRGAEASLRPADPVRGGHVVPGLCRFVRGAAQHPRRDGSRIAQGATTDMSGHIRRHLRTSVNTVYTTWTSQPAERRRAAHRGRRYPLDHEARSSSCQ